MFWSQIAVARETWVAELSPPDPVDRSLSDDVGRLADWIRQGHLPEVTADSLRSLAFDGPTHEPGNGG